MDDIKKMGSNKLHKLEKQMDESILTFNSGIKKLINIIYNMYPTDNDLFMLKNRISFVSKSNPDALIKNAGPYLWDYRKQIQQANVKYFIQFDYEKKIQKKEVQGINIANMVFKLKNCWKLFNDVERNEIIEIIQNMLSTYATFLSIQKRMI